MTEEWFEEILEEQLTALIEEVSDEPPVLVEDTPPNITLEDAKCTTSRDDAV